MQRGSTVFERKLQKFEIVSVPQNALRTLHMILVMFMSHSSNTVTFPFQF